jgi:hypothetical protein
LQTLALRWDGPSTDNTRYPFQMRMEYALEADDCSTLSYEEDFEAILETAKCGVHPRYLHFTGFLLPAVLLPTKSGCEGRCNCGAGWSRGLSNRSRIANISLGEVLSFRTKTMRAMSNKLHMAFFWRTVGPTRTMIIVLTSSSFAMQEVAITNDSPTHPLHYPGAL